MGGERIGAILAALARRGILLALGLTLLAAAAAPVQGMAVTLPGMAVGSGASDAGGGVLERRLGEWPQWRLPAPLPRPGRGGPRWPHWFVGDWIVQEMDVPEASGGVRTWRARFRPDGRGGARADRAFNARSLGRALLGTELLDVRDDPSNPQRQLSRLRGDRLLETTLVGQRGESPSPDLFLNDELSLQVLHGGGAPRVSRIETLGRWRQGDDGTIEGEQWQARYGSPADGLATSALGSGRGRLRLVPVPPGSGPAS